VPSRTSSRRFVSGCLAVLLILCTLPALPQALLALGSAAAHCCRTKHSCCCHRTGDAAGWTDSSPCGSNCPGLATLANAESGAWLSGAGGMGYRPPRSFAEPNPTNPADVPIQDRPPLYQRPPPSTC